MTKLELKNVYKAFPSSEEGIQIVLEDINLEAEDKEFICIVGPSGCGKSTILRMIAGLIPTTHGEISLNGKEVSGPDPNRGMVFQQPSLFPWRTVEENISFSQDMTGESHPTEVNRLIKLVNLEGYEDYYPKQLSGGMAQRVSLARTMINKPEVFLLDEPLGALDAFTRNNLQDELIELWKDLNNLVIMVTHDVEEAIYLSTKVVVMQPHPGHISEVVTIDLDYPRNRTDEHFTEYRNQIMDYLDID